MPFIGNGQQGFQTPIKEESFIVENMGALGNVHSERGLTYYEVALSGHMYVLHSLLSMALLTKLCRVPQFSPQVSSGIQYVMSLTDNIYNRRLSISWSSCSDLDRIRKSVLAPTRLSKYELAQSR